LVDYELFVKFVDFTSIKENFNFKCKLIAAFD